MLKKNIHLIFLYLAILLFIQNQPITCQPVAEIVEKLDELNTVLGENSNKLNELLESLTNLKKAIPITQEEEEEEEEKNQDDQTQTNNQDTKQTNNESENKTTEYQTQINNIIQEINTNGTLMSWHTWNPYAIPHSFKKWENNSTIPKLEEAATNSPDIEQPLTLVSQEEIPVMQLNNLQKAWNAVQWDYSTAFGTKQDDLNGIRKVITAANNIESLNNSSFLNLLKKLEQDIESRIKPTNNRKFINILYNLIPIFLATTAELIHNNTSVLNNYIPNNQSVSLRSSSIYSPNTSIIPIYNTDLTIETLMNTYSIDEQSTLLLLPININKNNQEMIKNLTNFITNDANIENFSKAIVNNKESSLTKEKFTIKNFIINPSISFKEIIQTLFPQKTKSFLIIVFNQNITQIPYVFTLQQNNLRGYNNLEIAKSENIEYKNDMILIGLKPNSYGNFTMHLIEQGFSVKNNTLISSTNNMSIKLSTLQSNNDSIVISKKRPDQIIPAKTPTPQSNSQSLIKQAKKQEESFFNNWWNAYSSSNNNSMTNSTKQPDQIIPTTDPIHHTEDTKSQIKKENPTHEQTPQQKESLWGSLWNTGSNLLNTASQATGKILQDQFTGDWLPKRKENKKNE